MDQWNYGPEKAWGAMAAIAKTLQMYLDQHIIQQYGFDHEAAFPEEIDTLGQEISTVLEHIEKIISLLKSPSLHNNNNMI